ncbi:hypothetical protein PAHAL_3G180900 [Panicum hallii]|uniref:Uncharacterized protein n=1 Tax=Panicum hallii TaxID=206008 RepID=A0A2S3H9M1_9POAL|nr:hypothetical protein PAHAL_3G180900 [Panicum hallii]
MYVCMYRVPVLSFRQPDREELQIERCSIAVCGEVGRCFCIPCAVAAAGVPTKPKRSRRVDRRAMDRRSVSGPLPRRRRRLSPPRRQPVARRTQPATAATRFRCHACRCRSSRTPHPRIFVSCRTHTNHLQPARMR